MAAAKPSLIGRFLAGFGSPPAIDYKAVQEVPPPVPFTNTGSWQNVTTTTRGQVYGGELPGLYAGTGIDFARAVGEMEQSSALMACVQWIQRAFPEAPARVVNKTPKGDEEIDGHAVTRLLDEPNPFMSGAAVFQAVLADYNIHGNAYLLKFRNAPGRVAELWWEPHYTIRPVWDASGESFIGGYQVRRNNYWYDFDANDVIHFRWSIDPRAQRLGISPFRAALRTIFTDEEAEAYTATILYNLGMPGVMISPATDKGFATGEAQALMAYFESRFTGDGRGRTLVSTIPTKTELLSFSPEQLNLRNIRMISEERISALIGVPPIVAGLGAGLERGTYSNYAQAREAAYEGNLLPTYRVFGDTLTRALLRDDFQGTPAQHVNFNLDDVRALQADENAKSTTVVNEWHMGVRMQNEARVELGLDPIPDGDRFIFDVAPQVLSPPAAPKIPAAGSGAAVSVNGRSGA